MREMKRVIKTGLYHCGRLVVNLCTLFRIRVGFNWPISPHNLRKLKPGPEPPYIASPNGKRWLRE
jgi:hypothetical protein